MRANNLLFSVCSAKVSNLLLKVSEIATAGGVTGTGIKEMNAANANQYFAGAIVFPDFMIYGSKMQTSGTKEVRLPVSLMTTGSTMVLND